MIFIYLDELSKEIARLCSLIYSELSHKLSIVFDPISFVNYFMIYIEPTVLSDIVVIGVMPKFDVNVAVRLANSFRAFSLEPKNLIINAESYVEVINLKTPGTDFFRNSKVVSAHNYVQLTYKTLETCFKYVLEDIKPSPRLELFQEDLESVRTLQRSDQVPESHLNSLLKIVESSNPILTTPSVNLFAKVLSFETKREVKEYIEFSKEKIFEYDILTTTSEEHWIKHLSRYAHIYVSLNVDPLIASYYLLKIYEILKQI
ncbi:hypothetical protein EYM_07850 [Ignicoccus islandicus DSM 13165]|uniref:Uncharacterized protein n=1 Tax=Ignicoccus islandicus DSM 13165 TaxID=940295 RepID=A0A0U3FAW3_9CREN|nr:hypothetical protein [Ignicoccus islandicus]ALU12825.1 hypothetical protein EYM_07850 [Ignicoccus islandicus DSM 13165]